METVTHALIQDLIGRLPATKLGTAYRMLLDLVREDHETPSSRAELLLIPANERRLAMADQAREMTEHYTATSPERQDWQAGDFIVDAIALVIEY